MSATESILIWGMEEIKKEWRNRRKERLEEGRKGWEGGRKGWKTWWREEGRNTVISYLPCSTSSSGDLTKSPKIASYPISFRESVFTPVTKAWAIIELKGTIIPSSIPLILQIQKLSPTVLSNNIVHLSLILESIFTPIQFEPNSPVKQPHLFLHVRKLRLKWNSW